MCFLSEDRFTLANRVDPDEMQNWCISEYKMLMQGVLTNFCWMYFPIFLYLLAWSLNYARRCKF